MRAGIISRDDKETNRRHLIVIRINCTVNLEHVLWDGAVRGPTLIEQRFEDAGDCNDACSDKVLRLPA